MIKSLRSIPEEERNKPNDVSRLFGAYVGLYFKVDDTPNGRSPRKD